MHYGMTQGLKGWEWTANQPVKEISDRELRQLRRYRRGYLSDNIYYNHHSASDASTKILPAEDRTPSSILAKNCQIEGFGQIRALRSEKWLILVYNV
jgi:hypothetical protein